MEAVIDVENDHNVPNIVNNKSMENNNNNGKKMIMENGIQSHEDKERVIESSNCLRFGIDAILKVKTDVTKRFQDVNKVETHERETATGCYKRTVNNLQSEADIDEHLEDDNALDKCSDYYDTDKADDNVDVKSIPDDDRSDVTETRAPYVHFPLAFSALRQNSVILPSQQSLFPMMNSSPSWSSALVSDLRKERFSAVRRVGHPYQNRTPPKRKKPRTSFTRLQIVELEKRFDRQKYLASTERSALAKSLKMSDAQVKTWFQNRRTKWRRQTAEERELERQAANRLLLSLQPDPTNRKPPMIISPDRMCLSQMQRFQERRSADV